MERLTLGQAIDNLKLDEVAVKVGGNYEDLIEIEEYTQNKIGFHYDTSDNNKLKSLNGCEVSLYYVEHEGFIDESFVIVKRHLYEQILDIVNEAMTEQE